LSESCLIASVIIIGYNDGRYLDVCLRSVLDQDMPRSEYEVIYADNGSTDGSADYVESHYPQVKLVRYPQNYGFAEGNNRAVPHAKGRYLVFLNLDTMVHRRWLPELILAMRNDPTLGACFSNQIVPLAPEYAQKDRLGLPKYTYLPGLSRWGYMRGVVLPFSEKPVPTLFLSGATLLVDRELLPELGFLFDNDYFIWAEDLDLGLRVYSLGYKIALVPTSILFHDTDVYRPSGGLPKMNARALRKAAKILRNRFITYYKNLNTSEFLLYLPCMLIGAPLKAREFRWKRVKQLAAFGGLTALSMYAFLWTVKDMPRFRHKRKHILSHRKTGAFWLLQALLAEYPGLPTQPIDESELLFRASLLNRATRNYCSAAHSDLVEWGKQHFA
jgi:GT2 family glycosyltransferase